MAHYFLGIEICHTDGHFSTQGKYISDIVDSIGLPTASEIVIPMAKGQKFKDPSTPYHDLEQKQRLLNLNMTRPDISHAVQQLSQFVGGPCDQHWFAALW